jgi:hypothetical protein
VAGGALIRDTTSRLANPIGQWQGAADVAFSSANFVGIERFTRRLAQPPDLDREPHPWPRSAPHREHTLAPRQRAAQTGSDSPLTLDDEQQRLERL